MPINWWEEWSINQLVILHSFCFSKISQITKMSSLKIVFLIESNVPSPVKSPGRTLWETIGMIIREMHYSYETVELDKLDFQEQESVNKFLNADIVIMVSRLVFVTFSSLSFRMSRIKIIKVFICIIKVHGRMSIVWMILSWFKRIILRIIMLFNIWKWEEFRRQMRVESSVGLDNVFHQTFRWISIRWREKSILWYDNTSHEFDVIIKKKCNISRWWSSEKHPVNLRSIGKNSSSILSSKTLTNRYFKRLEKRKKVVQDNKAEREVLPDHHHLLPYLYLFLRSTSGRIFAKKS